MELGTRLQHSGRGSQPHTQHRFVPRHEMTRRKLAASFPHPRSRGFRGPSLWGQKPRSLRLAGSVPPGLSRLPCPGPALSPRPERPPAPWAPERWGGPVRPSRLSSARPGPVFRPPRQRSGRRPRRLSSRPPHRPGTPRPWRPHRSPGPWGPREAAAPGRGGGGGRHHVCRPSQKPSAGRTKRGGGGGADTQADPADPRQTSGAGSPGNPAP